MTGTYFVGGSVSTGSLHSYDLFTAFAAALADIHPEAHQQLFSTGCGFLLPCIAEALEATSRWDSFWDSEAAAEALEVLTEALEACAPHGSYFGAHPGDGADFGFWAAEDSQ